jgi:hypothetical protein
MAKMCGMREVNLRVDGLALDFDLAAALARQVASKAEGEAICLAWFDRNTNRECPEVRECMHKPGWLAYARGHGADLSVVFNEGEYTFVFRQVEST